jgi:hypothetical protein
MRNRWLCTAGFVLGALIPTAITPASAKDYGPGDLRLCNAKNCAAIVDENVLKALTRVYYGQPRPAEVRAPQVGAPYFRLEFRNGYVTGIAATARLDRFHSPGWTLSQFGPDRWYRVAAIAARGLRTLAVGLEPLRVTKATIAPGPQG